MPKKIKDLILKHASSLLAPLPILLLQMMPTLVYRGVMLMPILSFFIRSYDQQYQEDLSFLFRPEHIPGWAIFIFGVILFLTALIDMLRKKNGLVTSGLYSRVRHPQYLGFIVMTWGISAVSLTAVMPWLREDVVFYWLLMSLIYVILAYFEEWYLLKEHPEGYKEYKEKVPFLFPVPHHKKIPQPILDVFVIFVLSFVLHVIYVEVIRWFFF